MHMLANRWGSCSQVVHVAVQVDVRRLLALKPDHDVHRTEFAAATSELEQKICSVWQELLHVERIGVHDNFWDLGGNSLLAGILMSKVRANSQIHNRCDAQTAY